MKASTILVSIILSIGSKAEAANLRTRGGANHQEEGQSSTPLRSEEESSAPSLSRELIINGDDAPRNRYPWMVRYAYWTSLCGGSLIAPDLVLTAAHCFNENDLGLAEVSRYDLSRADEGTPSRRIVERVQHPRYRNSARFNPSHDIAILKLETPITGVEPVKLNFDTTFPSLEAETSEVDLQMIGWGVTNDIPTAGKSNILQEATTTYVPFSECAVARDPTTGVRYGYNERRTIVKNDWLCTQHTSSAHCRGDSGGPIFRAGDNTGEQDTLVGVVSASVGGCDNAHLPQISQRISYHADWILEVGCEKSENPPAEWNCPGSEPLELPEIRVVDTFEDLIFNETVAEDNTTMTEEADEIP